MAADIVSTFSWAFGMRYILTGPPALWVDQWEPRKNALRMRTIHN